MEEFVYYNNLYDLYGNFLTDKQKDIFTLYYLENLSMQEIADLKHVSKSLVGKTIKDVNNKLELFESELKILEKNNKIYELLEEKDIIKIKKELRSIINK